jgi:hypothetical protein
MRIALVADRTGRYAHIWSEARTWNQFVDQLEDLGCEVIEEQTDDWEGSSKDEIMEDCLSVHQLIHDSDFVPHP